MAWHGEADDAGRVTLAQAMSRYAGVIRDADGLTRLVAGDRGGRGWPAARLLAGGAVRVERALVLDPVELETVEAANLRTVLLLIAAGALRRAESRGCHRRRDAAATADTPWHTLLRWDGRAAFGD